MLSKKEQLVITGIRCLHACINQHVDGWVEEFKNGGVLKANYKIAMYSIRKAINQLNDMYKLVPVLETYRDKFLDETKDFNFIAKNKDLKKDKYVVVKQENQGYMPYESFMNDFYLIDLFLTQLKEKYELTIKRMGLEDLFDKVIANYNYYGNFFEKEIVIA